MKLDPTPLIGQSLSSVENKGYSWFFLFSGGDLICTESAWRLITAEGIFVTSEDHGHQFGLPTPVDAAERVRKIIGTYSITDAVHDQKTGDLVVHFADRNCIQFLQMSCGYESWRLLVRDHEFTCMGGGEYASFDRNKS